MTDGDADSDTQLPARVEIEGFQVIPDIALNVSVNCRSCDAVLAEQDEMCFLFQNSAAIHLTLRYEVDETVRSRRLYLEPQSNHKRLKVAPHVMMCCKCNNYLGNEITMGPRREGVFCFSYESTYVKCNKFGKSQPRWMDLYKSLPGVEVRNMETFYGKEDIVEGSRIGKEQLPTYKCTRHSISEHPINQLVKFKPRPYQLECYIVAALSNTIIYLPTGAGKTLVAVMLAAVMKRLNPQKVIMLIVDRIPLVFQQGEYLREQTGMTVLFACGEVGSDSSETELLAHDAICCTAQLFLNFLETKRIRMCDVSLLIMDEIHHASGSHPYMTILHDYSRSNRATRPLLLGLTASPASGSILELIGKLSDTAKAAHCQYFTPCLYYNSLQESINRPQLGFAVIEPSNEEQRMMALVNCHVESVIKKAATLLNIPSELHGPEPKDMHVCRSFCRRLLESAHEQRCDIAGKVIQHLSFVYNSFEMMSVLGVRYAKDYLTGILTEMSSRPDIWNPEELRNSAELINLISEFKSISKKASSLVSILKEFPVQTESRVIVFVQTKKTARWLCSLLSSDEVIKADWNPAYFIGQGTGGTLEGMGWIEEQQPLLNLFRAGTVKLLISTSVLQEGLDVPMCNKIILFDRTWSLTSFVQSRGRARHMDSEYIVICSDEEMDYYYKLIKSEMEVHQEILSRIIQSDTLVDKAFLICNFKVECEQLEWKNETCIDHSNDISEERVITSNETNVEFSVVIVIHLLDAMIDLDGSNNVVSTSLHDTLFSGNYSQRLQVQDLSCSSNKQVSTILSMLDGLCLKHLLTNSVFECQVDPLENIFSSQKLFLVADSISSGYLVKPNHFVSLQEKLSCSVNANFNFGANMIEFVFFAHSKVWRLQCAFASLDQFVVYTMKPRSVGAELLLPWTRIPIVFYSADKNLLEKPNFHDLDAHQWVRASVDTCTLFNNYSSHNCLHLHFELNPTSQALFFAGLDRLRGCGVVPLYSHGIITSVDTQLQSINVSRLSSDTAYLINVLRSKCPQVIFTAELVQKLQGLCKGGFERVIEELPIRLQYNRFIDVSTAIDEIVSTASALHVSTVENVNDPFISNSTKIKMVVLSPLRTYFAGEQVLSRNRITRAFPPEHFLRVQFRDDDLFARLSKTHSEASLDDCFARFAKILKEGLMIGRDRFEFLAMSSSQLREHGCWFVKPFPHPDNHSVMVTADFIRQWCGNFSKITNIAKYVARLGQSFSASIQSVLITDQQFSMIDDIIVKKEKKEFNFTDGIGIISWALAKKLAILLQKYNHESGHMPCAYQIRFAGFKGVVAVDTNGDQESEWIRLRPSMRKFESPHRALEVLNVAEYIPGYMNRQVILILSGLGVSDEAFDRLQDEQLTYLARMLLDQPQTISAIQTFVRAEFVRKMSFSAPLSYSSEPFFRDILLSVYKKQLSDLLTKSRIFNPRGRILMGTVDETGTLAADEVFIQCSRQSRDLPDDESGVEASGVNGEMFVVVGKVAVAKNPCMHPGDIRVLKAVRNFKLEACRWDVIVFPSVGERPIPDMCSGSDLDGDLYNITWSPDLIPPITEDPMEYDAPPAKTHTISPSEIADFMIKFISNDQLGSIANAHVALSDQRPEGVRDPMCKMLAALFSLAVDFPKTGFVASLPDDASCESYPDFMLKPERPTYRSDKIIGRMFRRAKLAFDLNMDLQVRVDPRLSGGDVVDVALLESVTSLYHSYREDIRRCLCRHGLKSEAQVLSGSILDYQSFAKDEDIKDTMQVVMAVFRVVMTRTRADLLLLRYPPGLIAACCYKVCYEGAVSDGVPLGLSSPILSFAWLLGEHLERNLVESTLVSSPYGIIGKDLLDEYLAEDHSLFTDFMTRMEIAGKLKEQLGIDLELIGSTALFMFGPDSDLNLGHFGSQVMTIKDCKMETLSNQKIRYSFDFEGYKVTVEEIDNYENVRRLRSFVLNNLALTSTMVKWARQHRICRQSSRSDYKLSVSGLVTLMFELQSEAQLTNIIIDDTNSESSLFEKWMAAHRQCHNNNDNETLGRQVMHLLLCFSKLDGLSEAAYRSFHLLAQTLKIDSLWRHDSVWSAELAELDRRRRKLPSAPLPSSKQPVLGFVRKRSAMSGLFMEGASRVLFSRGRTGKDALMFDIYHGRRRPQHETAQCYTARPQLPVMEGRWSSYCRSAFYNHSFRQLIKLGSVGADSAVFGDVRAHIRLGRLYFTHLPRLFLEEGAASVDLLERALQKAYHSVDRATCRSLLRNSDSTISTSFEPVKPEQVDEIEDSIAVESIPQTIQEILDAQFARQNQTDKSKELPVNKRRRTTSSPMTSSFEPHVENVELVKRLLLDCGIIQSTIAESTNSTVMVSCELFDVSAGQVRAVQVTYNDDDLLVPIKITSRPLRWLCVDLVSNEGMDGRFSINSTKKMSVESVPKLIEADTDGHLKFLLPFSDQQRIFIRRQLSTTYSMTSPFFPNLVLSQVTEMDQCDPLTGRFHHTTTKWEVDLVDRSLQFAHFSDPSFVDRLLHEVIRLLQLLRVQ